MHKLGKIVIAIGLTASMASASIAWAEPLAPGKPAGVRQAQMGDKEWLVIGGIAAVGAGILIATAGGRSSDTPVQTVNVITTSP